MKIGDTVYHVADEHQEPRVITGIVQRPNSVTNYLVSTFSSERECYEIELTTDKQIF